MSKLSQFLKSLNKSGHSPSQVFVPAANTEPGLPEEQRKKLSGLAAVAETHYVQLLVTRMMLANGQVWFSKRYPSVYSIVETRYGDNSLELSNVAGPKKLGDLKPASLDKSLIVNQPLTGKLPFRGGSLGLTCGLVSLEAANLLQSFLDVVGNFAGKLAQPEISAVIDLAGPVANAVQELFTGGKAKTELYYSNNFSGDNPASALESGFILLSDHPSGTFDRSQVWVIQGEPRIGPSAAAAKPIQGHNYMLLQLKVTPDRDDWSSLRAIDKPLDLALSHKIAGKIADAEAARTAAIQAVYTSDDLTRTDRVRIAAAIRDLYEKAEGPIVSPLKVAMAAAMSAEEAASLDLPAMSDALAFA
jgi:hypothetical protein